MMLREHEVLDPAFNNVFKENVQYHELTIFSIQMSGRAAIVLTNSYIYILRKKIFKVALNKLSLKEITDIFLENDSLKIYSPKKSFSLKFKEDKKSHVKVLYRKIRNKL